MARILCAALILIVAASGYAADPTTPQKARGKRFAFLVGVWEYRVTELTRLRFPGKDVQGLQETLLRGGYEAENVVLMTTPVVGDASRYYPSRENIDRELAVLLKTLRPEDSVLIALAGHGVQFGQGNERRSYFCPIDANLADKSTLLDLSALYDALQACPAREKVLLVDACRNDPVANIRRAALQELPAVGVPQAQPLPKGVAALFSCSPDQFAFEDPDFEHGVFFHFVIEGLAGAADAKGDRNRAVSLTELEVYVSGRVAQHVRMRYGAAQVPQAKQNFEGAPIVALVPRDAVLDPPERVVDRPKPVPGGNPLGIKPMPLKPGENPLGLKPMRPNGDPLGLKPKKLKLGQKAIVDLQEADVTDAVFDEDGVRAILPGDGNLANGTEVTVVEEKGGRVKIRWTDEATMARCEGWIDPKLLLQ